MLSPPFELLLVPSVAIAEPIAGADLFPILEHTPATSKCGARHTFTRSSIGRRQTAPPGSAGQRRTVDTCLRRGDCQTRRAGAGEYGVRGADGALMKTMKRQARRTVRPHTPATNTVFAAVQVTWSPVKLKS